MISTLPVGQRKYLLIGAIIIEEDGPTNQSGTPIGGWAGALLECQKKLIELHGAKAHIINAKIECIQTQSTAKTVRVTGDLYVER